jgi:hypothetical protein
MENYMTPIPGNEGMSGVANLHGQISDAYVYVWMVQGSLFSLITLWKLISFTEQMQGSLLSCNEGIILTTSQVVFAFIVYAMCQYQFYNLWFDQKPRSTAHDASAITITPPDRYYLLKLIRVLFLWNIYIYIHFVYA